MAVSFAQSGSVYTLTAVNDVLTGKFVIRKIRWIKHTTVGNDLELRTGAYGTADIFFSTSASVANGSTESSFDPPIRIENLKVQTMTTGKLQITLA